VTKRGNFYVNAFSGKRGIFMVRCALSKHGRFTAFAKLSSIVHRRLEALSCLEFLTHVPAIRAWHNDHPDERVPSDATGFGEPDIGNLPIRLSECIQDCH
jgi:hypothetical protein